MPKRRDQIYDELLVLKCQAGDRQAFEELVERWQGRIWRYARALAGSEPAAWDIVQETWVAVIKGLGRLREPGLFAGWVFRIAANKSKDWLRRRQVHNRANGQITRESGSQADRIHANDEQTQALEAALGRITPDRRALLLLRYVEGFEIAEIGEILEIPAGTVKSRLSRTIAELRRLMGANSNG
ncbi:MAG: RNA polymerase sigma factor [Phycisphaerales bacterium]|nr:MAG: RNA polymerase sigma factor [Phycisphaerales bacterium]